MTDFRALCAELLCELEHATTYDYLQVFKDQARAALASSQPLADTVHPFVVRHYSSDEYPTIKGNGFDGLQVGEDRQEAEEFITWVNNRIVRPAQFGPQPPAKGEVAELIAALRDQYRWHDLTDAQVDRTAELLERLSDGPAVQSREPASVVTEPSDEELLELMPQQMRDDLAAAARSLAGIDPDNIKAASVFRIILNRHIADYASAVLARWGTTAPQPIPVSERLPEAGDCDAEGRCWIHMPDIGTAPSWRLVDPREIGPYHTHWLPHHALPLPSGEVK